MDLNINNINTQAGIIFTDPNYDANKYIQVDGTIFANTLTGGPVLWLEIPPHIRDAVSDEQLKELGLTREGDIL